MKFLISGGTGYIGSNIIASIYEKYHVDELVIIDDDSRGNNTKILLGMSPRPKLIIKKLEELKKDELASYDFDVIIHCGANAYVGESVELPHLYLERNVLGTIKLLEALNLEKIKKFIFSSTCAVYGSPRNEISENTMISPESPYGWSKFICENILEGYAQRFKFNLFIFRFFNVAGANPNFECGERHNPETHLIPSLFNAAMGNNEFIIFGNDYATKDGTCEREYVHVSDIVEAHMKAIDLQSSPTAKRINLCTGRPYSILQVIKAAEYIWKLPIKFKFCERRRGDAEKLLGNYHLANELLGWAPVNSQLEQILEDYAAWRIKINEI